MVMYGSGMSDSNLHMPKNLPTLLLGKGVDQLKGGQHLKFKDGTPITNLQLTLMDKMGVRLERFGDSTGTLNLVSGV
jgi:hypothetical protein